MNPEERAALLARAATWGTPRPELAAAVAVLGAGGNRERMLRRAHAEVWRLRKAGELVPFWLRVLEAGYQERVRKPRPAETGRRTPVSIAIREARERAGMSKRRLAAAVGVARTTVRRWECAEGTPAADNWVQLELALGPLGVVRETSPRPEAATGEADAA